MSFYEQNAIQRGETAEWLRELADKVEKVEEERDGLQERVKELEAENKDLQSEIRELEMAQP